MEAAKRFRWWAVCSALLILSQLVLPSEILGKPGFNMAAHFFGGILSALFACILLEMTPKSGWRFQVLGFGAVFYALFALGIGLEIFNFCIIKPWVPRESAYIGLIDNLILFAITSFLVSLFVSSPGFAKEEVLKYVVFSHIIFGPVFSGGAWEVVEFYLFGPKTLASWTNLTLYADTVQDIVMDGIGGITFFTLALASGRIRRML